MIEDDKIGVRVYLTYEDPRYPLLCVNVDSNTATYAINLDDGDLRRVCGCAAHSSSECLCGVWDA